ncbi:MAG: LOG family protein [Ignavibacteria bacterium]
MEKVITIFGSSFTSSDEELYSQVQEIGKLLAENNYTVCSGGYAGTMEAVSKGAKSAKGKTFGITVESWSSQPNKYIDENVKMPNLMERLTELIAIGDAYIIFKGGTGTLVEISVALELMNKKFMKEKPFIFFSNFWLAAVETLKNDSERVADLIKRNVNFVNNPLEIIPLLNSFKF